MEVLKSIPAAVLSLILVAALIGAGLVTFEKMKTAASKLQTMSNDSFTVTNATVQLTNSNFTSFSRITNGSGVEFGAGNYTVNLVQGNITFTLSVNATCEIGNPCYAWYEFRDYNTAGRNAANSLISALDDIPNNWMSLIVTVMVLGIIIMLILGVFGNKLGPVNR